MINILIIEDEKPAVEKISQMLREYHAQINIIATAGSIKESINWLRKNEQPDLILLDIQLSDGLSLEIFRHCPVNCPVIFTTAYDTYILEAFNYNGIDYLLKPVKQEKLQKALDKYVKLKSHFTHNILGLLEDLSRPVKKYKTRITVKKGIDFHSLPIEDIAFFYTEYKLVFLVTHRGEKFVVDRPLANLEAELNPADFFRVNRKYLVNIHAIVRFQSYFKGKILLELKPPVREEILISQEKAARFREWMDR